MKHKRKDDNSMGENDVKKNSVDADAAILETRPSPHIHCGSSIQKVMLQVVLCSLPIFIASCWFFGMYAVRVTLWCVAGCVIFEALWAKLTLEKLTVKDCSAIVTGILLAFSLPPSSPWWMCATGSFIAIVVAKCFFGGLGQNPFNPAVVARVALLLGFPAQMTEWHMKQDAVTVIPDFQNSADFITSATHHVSTGATHATNALPDFITGATPLGLAHLNQGNLEAMNYLSGTEVIGNAFWGKIGGSLGETSVIAILIGGFLLIAFRLIKWQIPVGILLTIASFIWITRMISPALTPSVSFQLVTGGAMLGAFFMATDPVTSPISGSGALFYGMLIGLLTCLIRIFGGYPEGVSFAILLANALVPLIDKMFARHPYGWIPFRNASVQTRRGEIQ